jgi:UDPglucose--hexose-1-phosphate uridylyltransferase
LRLPVGTQPCPFCPGGSPGRDPVELVADGDGSWTSQSFVNRWPASTLPEDHEVVVLSPRHDTHLATMGDQERIAFFSLLSRRAAAMRGRGRYPLVTLNHGRAAGASQPHPHAQILGLPRPSPAETVEGPALAAPSCVLCSVPPLERSVASSPPAAVVVPEAGDGDFDLIVIAAEHGGPFDARFAAWGVHLALNAIYGAIGAVAYNLLVHFDGHPHVHVTPRVGWKHGWELAGVESCMYLPERQASLLRAAVAELPGWSASTRAWGPQAARAHGKTKGASMAASAPRVGDGAAALGG